VVIPTHNEAENLPHVLPRVPAGVHELIIVDGHSDDGSPAVARRLHPGVRIVMQDRRGKGNALACGFRAATGDVIVALDADGSTDPSEIPRFVAALQDGADYAKGSRYLEGGGSTDLTGLRSFGNRTLGLLVNVLFRTRYTDLCYGYNAFWRDCFDLVYRECDGFEVETVLNVRAARAGLRISEVPSFEHERIHGTSNLRTMRDGSRVLRTIFRERFDRTRPRLAVAPQPGLGPRRAVGSSRQSRPRERAAQRLSDSWSLPDLAEH
jgi:glycosyltransferase involved in cell wall biosynthesis